MEIRSEDGVTLVGSFVYGNSDLALMTVFQNLKEGHSVAWMRPKTSSLSMPMPTVLSEKALGVVAHIISLSDQEGDTPDSFHSMKKGVLHRTFRSKSFKLPSWARFSDVEKQRAEFESSTWKPEMEFISNQEFGLTEGSFETVLDGLRARIEEGMPGLIQIEDASMIEFEVRPMGGSIQCADGPKIQFQKFYFCGSLQEISLESKLATILKKQIHFEKTTESYSALQVRFFHQEPVSAPIQTPFVFGLSREAGESVERSMLGYFISGEESLWTTFMTQSEIEDNHEIMKRLRKMKQGLNRNFEGCVDGGKDFTSTVEHEIVKFHPEYLVTSTRLSGGAEDFIVMPCSVSPTHQLERFSEVFGIHLKLQEHSGPVQGDDIVPVPEGNPEIQDF